MCVYLIEKGIFVDLLSVVGFGFDYLVMINDMVEGRVKNCWIEFWLVV